MPTEPRIITPGNAIQTIKGKASIAAGPIVYGFEATDNPLLNNYTITQEDKLQPLYKMDLLNGVNIITGTTNTIDGKQVSFEAIPFYSIGNRNTETAYKVWLPVKE